MPRREEKAEILVYSQYTEDLPRFREILGRDLPGVQIGYADTEAAAAPHLGTVRVLYGWGFPLRMATAMPRLAWIQKMGAGVEDMVREWPFGPLVTLTRTDGRLIAPRMVEYVVCALLRQSLGLERAEELREQRRWEYFELGSIRQHTVGVAGLGDIGAEIAAAVRRLGARVIGWRKTQAPCDAVERVFAGREQFEEFLSRCSAVVLVLPMTVETAGLVNGRAFAAMTQGTHLVNVGRGGIVDESALLEALHTGKVSHATLDVFATEPLPGSHPFWTEKRISITPHLCGPLIPADVAPHFIENFRAFREGRPLRNVVSPENQY